jgi:TolB protein
MTASRRLKFMIFAYLTACVSPLLMAQSEVPLELPAITGFNESAFRIAVVPFAWEATSVKDSTEVAAVISSDLNRSGKFRALKREDMVESPFRGEEIKFATWNALKQQYIVVGRVRDDAAPGTYRVEFELFNVSSQQPIARLAFPTNSGDFRATAHRIADLVYEKITGERGAFWTRVAYVTAVNTAKTHLFRLMFADSDGFNPQTVVKSPEPLMSPAWSPDGKYLAYVSFERGNGAVYVQEITTGVRRLVTSFKGINGAPAFSPDGSKLLLTLSRSGNPEINVLDLASNEYTQITKHYSIDTEPVFMPGGGEILFTSDRSGRPQIYRQAISGGTPSRLTSQGDYNARASVSADGKKIAMVQGNKNVYRIAVMDRERGDPGVTKVITNGTLDESPSFAPNGSMILYASKEGTRGVLYAVSSDGLVKQRLGYAEGDVREPAWGPFRPR